MKSRAVFACVLIGVATKGLGQALPTDVTVQGLINQAIATGQPSVTLPNSVILVNKTINVPPTGSGLTISGGNKTRLQRNSTNDFPLMVIGNDSGQAFSNTPFLAYPQFSIQPAVEGATALTLSSAATIAPGTYAIIGTNAPTDTVTLVGGALTYWFKREMIRITGQTGNTLQLAAPLGRDFSAPQLYQLEINGATNPNRRVTRNVQLVNFAMDGRLGTRVFEDIELATGDPNPKENKASKVLIIGQSDGVSVNNVKISGFRNSGIGVLFSRNTSISNCNITDGNVKSLGYGIEASGSRFTSIQNCSFSDVRWGALFSSGSMDSYVAFCSIPPGRGGFDVCHGACEKRITYQSCIGDIFSIGNPGWLRGGSDLQVLNCTAYREMNIYGNTQNVLISSKHPSLPYTTPRINFFTEQSSTALPNTVNFPQSVTVQFVTLRNSLGAGRTIDLLSLSGQAPKLGQIIFDRCSFENPLITGSSAVDLIGISNSTHSILFDNCFIKNSNSFSPPVLIGAVGPGGAWNIEMRGTTIQGVHPWGVRVDSGAAGLIKLLASAYNNATLSNANVQNNSSATVLF
jgi:hypothetical protein